MSDGQPGAFDLKLERVALGESAGSGTEQEAQLLAELAASSREILEEIPVESVVREVERRRRVALAGRQAAPRRRGALIGALAVGMAMALLLLVLRPGHKEAGTRELSMQEHGDPYAVQGGTRSKGDARLLVHLQSEDGTVELHDRDEASRGDTLQLSYLAADEHYGVIFSLDGRGTRTLHLPESPGDAVVLAKDKQALPSSYQLDDAPKFERFYFITASEPFSTALVLEAAKAAAENEHETLRLSLDKKFSQYVFTVRKVQR